MAGPFGKKYHPPAGRDFDPAHYARLCRMLSQDFTAIQELFNLSGCLKLDSYDLTTASGTQDITGFVGFLPNAGVILAGVNGGTTGSVGLFCPANNFVVADLDGTKTVANDKAILVEPSSGNSQAGVISRIPTGLRITWTKTGSPTGTALIGVLGLVG